MKIAYWKCWCILIPHPLYMLIIQFSLYETLWSSNLHIPAEFPTDYIIE